MNYPVWELAFGGGVLIGVVSIVHVLISHFAVGGGLWLVLTEARAYRQEDPDLLEFVKRHSRFFMLLTLVLGAITGVGIWFAIALVSPATVSALIHAYLWGWAIEWVFFTIEIAAAMVYYYGWRKLDRRTHLAVGWIYFGAAWLSMVIINGIITFMLTPGGWLENREFWTGFFNPTYWPSLAVRTVAALGLAGIFTLLTASLLPRNPFRDRVTRYCAGWVVVSAILGPLGAFWYRSAFPGYSEALLGAVPVLPATLAAVRIGLIAVLVVGLWAWLLPRRWNPVGAVLLLAAALTTFAGGEWLREAGRKPFTIHGYMYSTGLRVDQEARLAADGMMAHTHWFNQEVGHDPVAIGGELYRAHCQPCHTWNGYNGLRPYLAHWKEETIASLLPRLDSLRGLMPPWYGDNFENECLSQYLLTEGAKGDTTVPANVTQAERLAWNLSCGLCHTENGYRPLQEALAGQTAEEITDLLEMVGDLVDEMPPYFGQEPLRGHLIRFLERLGSSEPQTAATPPGQNPILAEGRAP